MITPPKIIQSLFGTIFKREIINKFSKGPRRKQSDVCLLLGFQTLKPLESKTLKPVMQT
jgi:hypothetical protein